MPTEDNRSMTEILDSLKQMKLDTINKFLTLVDQIIERQEKQDESFRKMMQGEKTRASHAATHRNLQRSIQRLDYRATDMLWDRVKRELQEDDWGTVAATVESYGYSPELRDEIIKARENVKAI